MHVGTFDAGFRYNRQDVDGQSRYVLLGFRCVFVDEFGYLGEKDFIILFNIGKVYVETVNLYCLEILDNWNHQIIQGSSETHEACVKFQ